MFLCSGVVKTLASEAHWLIQAETKRQMVVVCGVYCNSDLTALLYLFVFMCAAVCMPARANAIVSWQRKRFREHERRTVSSPISFTADGFLPSLSRRLATPGTKLYYSMLYCCQRISGNSLIVKTLACFDFYIFVTSPYRNCAHKLKLRSVPGCECALSCVASV